MSVHQGNDLGYGNNSLGFRKNKGQSAAKLYVQLYSHEYT